MGGYWGGSVEVHDMMTSVNDWALLFRVDPIVTQTQTSMICGWCSFSSQNGVKFYSSQHLGLPEKRVLLQSRLLARRPVWQQDLRTDHWYSMTEGAMMQPGDEINSFPCCSCRSVDVNGLIWIDWFFAQLSCGCSCTWEHDQHATEDSSMWQVVRFPWCACLKMPVLLLRCSHVGICLARLIVS